MKREERRRQILARASDVFAEKGYHAAKIDDIVAHARIARGTFYLHFSDKRAVFEHLVDHFLDRIGQAIERIRVDENSPPPLLQLRDNVHRVLSVGVTSPQMTKILLKNATGLDADFDRKVHGFYRALEDLLSLSLLNGQRLGLVRTGDRRLLGAMALGAIKEVLLQSVENRINVDAQTLTDEVMRFLAAGILTPGLVVDAALSAPARSTPSVSPQQNPLEIEGETRDDFVN